MVDPYNLSWKLAHSINSLTPKPYQLSPDPVVASFEHELLTVARQLNRLRFEVLIHVFRCHRRSWLYYRQSYARTILKVFND